MVMVHHQRILLVIFSTQSHINPALQFSKRLISMGAHVTLVITVQMHRRMAKKPTIPGLSVATFSDGYDDGFSVFGSTIDDYKLLASETKRRGSEFLRDLIVTSRKQGHPFSCLTYTLLNPWAHEVAREFQLLAALLWIEPATVFSISHYYFHGYDEYISRKVKEEPGSCSIEIPGLSLLLSPSDIPTFLTASRTTATMSFMFPLIEKQFHLFDEEPNPVILVNTFEALETEALRSIDRLNMISIGPLVPSAFSDGKDPSDNSFGGDIYEASNDYIEWLDSKTEESVVYLSFGSYFELSKRQEEEIARALLDFGRPFLWIMRGKSHEVNNGKTEEVMSFRKELESKGKIVKWCSQVEVLSHPSLGCFVSHCGWNSTIESLVSGVPVVAFPQWADQKTNAKLLEDVWKTGVRVDHMVNEEGVLEAEDIRRCLDVVMGNKEKGVELKKNAKKWKELAREAVRDGGSSDQNLKTFLDCIAQKCINKE